MLSWVKSLVKKPLSRLIRSVLVGMYPDLVAQGLVLRQELAEREAAWRQELAEREAAWRQELVQWEAKCQHEFVAQETQWQDTLATHKAECQHAFAVQETQWQHRLTTQQDLYQQELANREAAWRQDRAQLETQLRQEMINRDTALHQEMLNCEYGVKKIGLQHRAVLSRAIRKTAKQIARPVSASLAVESHEIYVQKMAALLPDVFPTWHSLFAANERAYRQHPEANCSVAGHETVENFRGFVAPYLSNRVLDIGCGPQPLPAYLQDYPVELISGIDPLLPQAPHPFEFVHGFAEFLPWQDSTFDVVIVATSLDHVLSLERSLTEMTRVLVPHGVVLIWVGFIPGAVPYDTSKPHPQPVDEFHMFHFDEGWFEALMSTYFTIKEKLNLDRVSHFYCLSPK